MIETIKNLSNIFFFLVVASIGILSYLQARKTLFSPIRTETFKLQLKAFEDILAFFQNKSESDFLEIFDFDRIVSLNTLQMADSYVNQFFAEELTVDKDARKETYAPFIGAIVSKDYMEKYFEKVDTENPMHKSTPAEKKITNPAIVLSKWQKYEHGMVSYTKQYQDQLKELTRLSASPLLPKSLREFIGRFQAVAHENLSHTGETISKCSKLMPEHFPVAADMKNFTPNWVWNEFNSNRKHFEPVAKEILDYINGYLKIENLMQ